MQVQPYLFFEGRCDEAVAFYQQALGARLQMLLRYKDSPQPVDIPRGLEERIMHATLQVGDSEIMVSDGHCAKPPHFEGFSLSLTVATEEEADGLFAALSDGGQVRMPLAETFFSPRYGMVTDRFGVLWMVYVARH